jgi:hypothetical protein
VDNPMLTPDGRYAACDTASKLAERRVRRTYDARGRWRSSS